MTPYDLHKLLWPLIDAPGALRLVMRKLGRADDGIPARERAAAHPQASH